MKIMLWHLRVTTPYCALLQSPINILDYGQVNLFFCRMKHLNTLWNPGSIRLWKSCNGYRMRLHYRNTDYNASRTCSLINFSIYFQSLILDLKQLKVMSLEMRSSQLKLHLHSPYTIVRQNLIVLFQ